MSKKTDILYIHPTKLLSNTKYSIIPVGLIGLLNLLIQKGYRVMGINNGIEKFLNPDYELENELKTIYYKILIIDLHWYEHSYGAVAAANLSKKMYPQRPVIIGGLTTTIYASEILENFPAVDYAVKGDGEKPLIMLVDYLVKQEGNLDNIPNLCFKDNEKVVNKEITYISDNIDALDYVSVDFLKNKMFNYYLYKFGLSMRKNAVLYMGRGCPYNCSFCSASNKNSSIFFGKENRFTSRSPEAVFDDMERLYRKGVRLFQPTLSFRMLEDSYYKELFAMIRSKKYNAGILAPCCQLPTHEFLMDLKKTFNKEKTYVLIAPYTGDEEARKLNGGRQFTNKELLDLLRFMSQNKIKVRLLYARNVHNENADSFELTIRQLEEVAEFYPNELCSVFCERIYLEPLAPIIDEGIDSRINSFMDCYHYCRKDDESDPGYSDNSTPSLDERLKRFTDVKNRLGLSDDFLDPKLKGSKPCQK